MRLGVLGGTNLCGLPRRGDRLGDCTVSRLVARIAVVAGVSCRDAAAFKGASPQPRKPRGGALDVGTDGPADGGPFFLLWVILWTLFGVSGGHTLSLLVRK